MPGKPNCVCSVCGAVIYRSPKAQALGNVYCSHACRAKAQQKPVPCVVCGKMILASKHAKTCSRACANKHRAGIKYKVKDRKNQPLKDKVKWIQGLKRRLIAQRGVVCEPCSYPNTNILVVHHRIRRCDGGSDDLSNLELICPNCHAEIHYADKQKPFTL